VETVWETGNNEKKGKHAAVERRQKMALRKFKIRIEGKDYVAEVEEIIEGETPPVSDIKKEPAASIATSATQTKKTFSGSAKTVLAPMPGKIVALKCTVGQSVKSGDVVLILEAMKMEQEIKAKTDGTIAEIKVSVGMTVQKEDILISIN
jgi:biotin carboxyl carrier protein